MAESAEPLRADVDRHLSALGDLDELSDERYHLTHERFEAASDQRQRILEWIGRFVDSMQGNAGRSPELLSVGCGGGVMDRRIADVVAEGLADRRSYAMTDGRASPAGSVEITGIDPNPQHIPAFAAAFEGSPHRIGTFVGGFEDFETERRFDLVYFLHCLYYFDTIAPALRAAVERLRPGGAVVVLQAPNGALNHLADRVWRKQFDQSAWYSDDVRKVLESMDGRTTCERIDARVDVTACFESDNPAGIELLDFIVQTDTRCLSEDLRASLRKSLRAICEPQGERLFAPHPVDALVFRPN